MSVINRLAVRQGKRDEVPNQDLARELADKEDREAIREIARNLWNKERGVANDCVKVLYEIGYIKPELIAEFAEDFLKLIRSRNNRMAWGAMIALGTAAHLKARAVFEQRDAIIKAMEEGSVITVDNAVKVLAQTAAQGESYSEEIFPLLLRHLETCRPKDVPQHSEKTLPAVNARNSAAFRAVLKNRLEDLQGGQAARVKKVLREAEKRTSS